MVPAPFPLWNVFPVPPEVKIPGDRSLMDNYVKEFVPHHGYKIIIGHSSSKNCNIVHYDCHRGGKPHPPKPKITGTTPDLVSAPKPLTVTRSIKIQCPFRLTAKFDSDSNAWCLTHVQLGHNHEPTGSDPNKVCAFSCTPLLDSFDVPLLASCFLGSESFNLLSARHQFTRATNPSTFAPTTKYTVTGVGLYDRQCHALD